MLRPSGDRQPPATRGEGRRVSSKESRDSEPSDIKRLNFALTHGELATFRHYSFKKGHGYYPPPT
jgi:hypothetical protein